MASGHLWGAIRWDFWYSMTGACRSTARNVGNPKYRSRAPFFAREVSSNYVNFDGLQADMDAEITYAVNGGLSYWAFLLYNRSGGDSEGMQGYDLYQASALKNNIKWAQMRQSNLWGSTGNYATQVADAVAMCQTSNYQMVLTNRPLVYIYYESSELASFWGGSLANFKAAIDSFRTGCTNAGLGNPYIVLMQGGGTSAAATMTALGCQAISSYISRIPSGLNQPFTSLTTSVQAYWEEMRAAAVAAGGKNVPICMAGWAKGPRIERPVSWGVADQPPFIGSSTPIALPTNAELVTQFAACNAFMDANPTDHDSNAVLVYAWNEFDEGGWLCPTLGDPTGSRLTAIASTISF